ncbi:MAG TPA: gliding motility-associated C-terminal domain-containing protein [Leptospiraceae bacterium]|nr:gliding motility-associated C-terminal domain-containing protein [Leptospiraceae bacterium]HMW04072.1 gliding motility-associated C-terminal domain-containing protein [Leptospiraceae bacterium]HMX30861.1 gliding motility-associated C-terminal domain-containing protein [Leptospiraceae bacterium]HMY30066.1 gliding motility-associated C-terminal domain-containing protein [Leptospiraceae bacterium]HMZ62747.1 gliding motility-associated C-terminal domain-containing protein [Leptospiraceae bacteri
MLRFIAIILLFIIPIFSEDSDSLILETPKVFFSPNYDDINDTMVFQIKYSGSKTPVDWKIHIADENGKVIKVFSADLRRKRKGNFLRYLFSNDKELEPLKVTIPEKIEWLGNDNVGKMLPDGRYIHQMKIFFSDKSEIKSKPVSIYLDSIAPYAKLSTENRFFTPNGDKIFDQLIIKQDVSADPSDRWNGVIYNEQNEPIRTFQWETRTIPKILNWDGKDDRGILQDDGVYSYQLTGEDFSQNKMTTQLENLYLSKSSDNIDIQPNLSIFSPNGDKLKETVIFKPIANEKFISKWEMNIYEKDGNKENTIRNFSGEVLPTSIEWDGKNTNGKLASDGTYFYRLKCVVGSKNLKSPERKVTVNTKDKKIYFKLSEKSFTPDGDETSDYLEIFPELENFTIKTWKLTILQKYPVGDTVKTQVIKKWKGIGQPAKRIVWDGYTDQGFLIGSLSNLELHFSFRNELNELLFFKVKEFSTGILVTGKEDKLRISIPESTLKKEESKILNEIKKLLSLYPGYRVQIQTHSKQPGEDKVNMKRTEARARDLFKKMFDRDMDFERYTYQAYGEVEPLFYDEDEYKQELNDRFDVLLTFPEQPKKK